MQRFEVHLATTLRYLQTVLILLLRVQVGQRVRVAESLGGARAAYEFHGQPRRHPRPVLARGHQQRSLVRAGGGGPTAPLLLRCGACALRALALHYVPPEDALELLLCVCGSPGSPARESS